MKVIADTNILVRIAVVDDAERARRALDLLREAETVAVTLPALCELVWVLARGYRRDRAEIADAIRRLVGSETVQADRPAVEAGLKMLEAGGDIADGIIAFEGRRLGGSVFASFDRRAVELVAAAGGNSTLL